MGSGASVEELQKQLALINAEREVVEAQIVLETRKTFLANLKKEQGAINSIETTEKKEDPKNTSLREQKPGQNNIGEKLEKKKQETVAEKSDENSPTVDVSRQLTKAARPPFAYFTTGTRTLAPYNIVKIDDTHGFIDSSSTRTQAFAEFNFKNIWAWQEGRARIIEAEKGKVQFHGVTPFFKSFSLEPPPQDDRFFKRGIDYNFRLSYNFGKDDKLNASTVASSGDFSAEATMAPHIYRGVTDFTTYSVNGIISWSGVTERAGVRIDNRWFVGPGAFFSWDAQGQQALFSVRGGWSRFPQTILGDLAVRDVIGADGKTTSQQYRPVALAGGRPVYRAATAATFEAELLYPLTETTYLTLGARLYGRTDPGLWDVHVALTLPMEQLTSAFVGPPKTVDKK